MVVGVEEDSPDGGGFIHGFAILSLCCAGKTVDQATKCIVQK
jgi:hypothetical protein